jgi:hypothetical protein
MTHYMASTERGKAAQMTNGANKLINYSTLLDITTGEIASQKNDAVMYTWILDVCDIIADSSHAAVAYKETLTKGPIGATLGPVPVQITLPSTPVNLVAAGILARHAAFVARLKNHPNFTKSIGEDLGYIAPVSSFDPDTAKPKIWVKIFFTIAIFIVPREYFHDLNRHQDTRCFPHQQASFENTHRHCEILRYNTPHYIFQYKIFLLSVAFIGQTLPIINATSFQNLPSFYYYLRGPPPAFSISI